jgi:hypothetical protein
MDRNSSTSSFRDVRRFAIKAALLLALLVACDRLGGALAEHWYFKTRDGDTGGEINALLEKRADVLVFGDSRAESHYVPDILAANLDTTAFNAGYKGANTLYDYALEQLVLDYYTPKLIVYDFSPYSLRSDEDPYTRLYPLHPYWRNEHLWELLAKGGTIQRLSFLSRLYPYNSKIHSILLFNVIDHRPNASDGYVGQNGNMKPEPIEPIRSHPEKYSEELIDYLDRFFVVAHEHGIRLIVTMSPRYASGDFVIPVKILRRLAAYGVPIIDFGIEEYPLFTDPKLFRDVSHLGDRGARLFTRLLAEKIDALAPDSRSAGVH